MMNRFFILLSLLSLTRISFAQVIAERRTQSYCYTVSNSRHFSDSNAGEAVARCANDFQTQEPECYNNLKCVDRANLEPYCFTLSNRRYFSHRNSIEAVARCANAFDTQESECHQNLRCFDSGASTLPQPTSREEAHCFTNSQGKYYSDVNAGEAAALCSNDFESIEAECYANLKCYDATAPSIPTDIPAPAPIHCNITQLASCLKFSGGLACYTKWQCPRP